MELAAQYGGRIRNIWNGGKSMGDSDKISRYTEHNFQKNPLAQGSKTDGQLLSGRADGQFPSGSFQTALARQADQKFSHGRRRISEDGWSGPTEEELLQVKLERKKKWKREAEYSRLLEEASLERRYKEKIRVKKYPHGSISAKSGMCNAAGSQGAGSAGNGQ